MTIKSITDQIEDSVELEILGFTPGTPITLHSKAPFSGPLTMTIRGSKIAIRKEAAECILVNL